MYDQANAKQEGLATKRAPALVDLLLSLNEEINVAGQRAQDIYGIINRIKNIRHPDKEGPEPKAVEPQTVCDKLEFEIGRLRQLNRLLIENKDGLESIV